MKIWLQCRLGFRVTINLTKTNHFYQYGSQLSIWCQTLVIVWRVY